MKISPARVAAFTILKRIETERAFSSILLPEHEENLSFKDRALCHQIVLGTLRKIIFLDRAIDQYAGRSKIDVDVRVSLRIGLYQLWFLDKIPDHSAVDESVNLVVRAKKNSARGFANAVLRRAIREPFVPQFEDDFERLSVETSHPRWLIERWSQALGFAEAEKLAAANNTVPKTALRFTAMARDREAFPGIAPSKNVSGCFIADSFTPDLAAAARAGEIYFQDEGSQLVGGAVRLPRTGRFIDVCAAPGSKATQIMTANIGSAVEIFAGDFHANRTRLLLDNARSQGLQNLKVVRYDAERHLPFDESSFDVVLVDAPCSGTGTIRHNPEIRYLLDPGDFDILSDKQRRILRNASKLVKIGGSLIYSTCSLEREENEVVAEDFLGSCPDFVKIRPNVDERFMNGDDFARTLPHRDEMDGFFIAAFQRIR